MIRFQHRIQIVVGFNSQLNVDRQMWIGHFTAWRHLVPIDSGASQQSSRACRVRLFTVPNQSDFGRKPRFGDTDFRGLQQRKASEECFLASAQLT